MVGTTRISREHLRISGSNFLSGDSVFQISIVAVTFCYRGVLKTRRHARVRGILEGYLGDIWRKFGGHLEEFWRKFAGKLGEIWRKLGGKNLILKNPNF